MAPDKIHRSKPSPLERLTQERAQGSRERAFIGAILAHIGTLLLGGAGAFGLLSYRENNALTLAKADTESAKAEAARAEIEARRHELRLMVLTAERDVYANLLQGSKGNDSSDAIEKLLELGGRMQSLADEISLAETSGALSGLENDASRLITRVRDLGEMAALQRAAARMPDVAGDRPTNPSTGPSQPKDSNPEARLTGPTTTHQDTPGSIKNPESQHDSGICILWFSDGQVTAPGTSLEIRLEVAGSIREQAFTVGATSGKMGADVAKAWATEIRDRARESDFPIYAAATLNTLSVYPLQDGTIQSALLRGGKSSKDQALSVYLIEGLRGVTPGKDLMATPFPEQARGRFAGKTSAFGQFTNTAFGINATLVVDLHFEGLQPSKQVYSIEFFANQDSIQAARSLTAAVNRLHDQTQPEHRPGSAALYAASLGNTFLICPPAGAQITNAWFTPSDAGRIEKP